MSLLRRIFFSTALLILSILIRSGIAMAQKLGDKKAAQDGIFSLIEMNPADLLWGRYRIANENLVFESTSLAWVGELQEWRQKGNFKERSAALGLSLQYYPQSITLTGPFFRGETQFSVLGITEYAQNKQTSQSGYLALLKVGGDLGWRVRLSDRLTGSAAYGLRSSLPQILWNSDESLGRRWLENGDSFDVRVQINLGILL